MGCRWRPRARVRVSSSPAPLTPALRSTASAPSTSALRLPALRRMMLTCRHHQPALLLGLAAVIPVAAPTCVQLAPGLSARAWATRSHCAGIVSPCLTEGFQGFLCALGGGLQQTGVLLAGVRAVQLLPRRSGRELLPAVGVWQVSRCVPVPGVRPSAPRPRSMRPCSPRSAVAGGPSHPSAARRPAGPQPCAGPCQHGSGRCGAGIRSGLPASEGHEHVLDPGTAVQPRLLDGHEDAAALPQLADDAQRALRALAGDPVQRPDDEDRELPGPRVVQHLLMVARYSRPPCRRSRLRR